MEPETISRFENIEEEFRNLRRDVNRGFEIIHSKLDGVTQAIARVHGIDNRVMRLDTAVADMQFQAKATRMVSGWFGKILLMAAASLVASAVATFAAIMMR